MGFISKLFNKDEKGLEKEQTSDSSDFHPFPYGSSGTTIYSGYFDEDYLEALKNNERADVFDKMRRSDPQIKMCLSAVKNPIKSAAAEIHPAGDDFYYKNDARLIEKILFDGDSNIDVMDVVLGVNIVLDSGDFNNLDVMKMDVNWDGGLDILDVVAIVGEILGT